jgi:hypothetical protein
MARLTVCLARIALKIDVFNVVGLELRMLAKDGPQQVPKVTNKRATSLSELFKFSSRTGTF